MKHRPNQNLMQRWGAPFTGGLALVLLFGCSEAPTDEGPEIRSVTQATVGVLGSTEAVQVINTLSELRNMSVTGNYRLGSDIDASETESVPFRPIGFPKAPFSGTFDGDGHTIDNLHISDGAWQGTSYTGLFGSADEAIITDVGLTNVQVSGADITGALVGSLNRSLLSDCYVTGTVTADFDARSVGMVVGILGHSSTVTRCSVVGTLDGGGSLIGGFVGRVNALGRDSNAQMANLSEIFTDVRVSSDKNWGNVTAGGLAGAVQGAAISHINAVGPVSGREAVGGIVGYATNGDPDSYATWMRYSLYRGNVTDHASSVDRAGLVGDADAPFERCDTNAWDEGTDNGTPSSVSTDFTCQAGYPSEVLMAPHPAPDRLIDPFYAGMFVTQELIDDGIFDQCKLGSGSDGDWGFGTCDTEVIWYLNAEDEHISLARVPIPEAQPLGPDSLGSCTEANAIDLGAQHAQNTVAADACLKVTQYPGQWMNFVVLQSQENGNAYPIEYDYQTCEGSGADQFDADWDQSSIPADSGCATLIQLNGSPYESFAVKWWAGG